MGERKFKVGDEVLLKGTVIEIDYDFGILVDTSLGRISALREDLFLFREDDKTYEQGLEEGWELAEKVISMSHEERDNILGTNLDNHSIDCIMDSFTAAKVKEKFEQYDRLHNIRVGDKVISEGFSGGTGLVTFINPVRKTADILLRSGKVIKNVNIKTLLKVSGHVDMCELLNKLWD